MSRRRAGSASADRTQVRNRHGSGGVIRGEPHGGAGRARYTVYRDVQQLRIRQLDSGNHYRQRRVLLGVGVGGRTHEKILRREAGRYEEPGGRNLAGVVATSPQGRLAARIVHSAAVLSAWGDGLR